jgi:sugar lactone lactonase YvrE
MTWKRALLTGLIAPAAMAALGGCGDESTGPEPTTELQPGDIETWAGTGAPGFDGDGHALKESRFYWPMEVTVSSTGETFVLDWNNHRVRRVEPDGTLRTVIGTDFIGDGPPDFGDLTQPGAPGTTINLNHPTHLIELLDGTYLLSSWHNHKLRVWDPATGLVYVLCGREPNFAGDNGPVSQARLNQPPYACQAPDGSIYVFDQRNQRIRKVDPAEMMSTVVGSATDGDGDGYMDPGYAGDGGPPASALVAFPTGGNPTPGGGLILDSQGRLYFSDTNNQRIRRVDFQADRIETVVGNGVPGFAGDGGPGTAAAVNNPRDLEFGPDGRLYIADELNNRVRAWDPVTGIVTTVAGDGTAGFSGDGGPATAAQLNRPSGLAFDLAGLLYIADSYNHRIRRVRLEGN